MLQSSKRSPKRNSQSTSYSKLQQLIQRMLKDTSIHCLEAKCSRKDFLWTTARSLGALFPEACPTETIEKVCMMDDLFVRTADSVLVLKNTSQRFYLLYLSRKRIQCLVDCQKHTHNRQDNGQEKRGNGLYLFVIFAD